ncbi:unnamed protein product [Amoebophrya sp. A25]|nr:unnamed protein product [Amoebophrya sp. A25]|eukprot:GSA25T00004119001.1
MAAAPVELQEDIDFSARPDPCTNVRVKILVRELRIAHEGGSEQLQVRIGLHAIWNDLRVKDFPPEQPLPVNIWRPEFNFHQLEVAESSQSKGGSSVSSGPNSASATGGTTSAIPPGPLPMFFSKDPKIRDFLHMTIDSKLLKIDLLDGNARNRASLRSFPFDGFKFDFVAVCNGAVRLENTSQVDAVFDGMGLRQDYLDWKKAEGGFAGNGSSDSSVPAGGPLLQSQASNSALTKYSAATGAGEHFRFEAPLLSGEFAVTRFVYGMGENKSPLSGMFFRHIFFRIEIQRDPTYYLHKGVAPMLVLFLVSVTSTICLNSRDFAGDKLNVLLAAFLTLFAIQWTIADRLPRLPFLTELDRVTIRCGSGLLVLVLGVAVSHQVALNVDKNAENGDGASSSEKLLSTSGIVSLLTAAVAFVWVATGVWRMRDLDKKTARLRERSRRSPGRQLMKITAPEEDYVIAANGRTLTWKKPPFLQGKVVRALKYDVVLPGLGPITFISRPLCIYEAREESDYEAKVGSAIELEDFDPQARVKPPDPE